MKFKFTLFVVILLGAGVALAQLFPPDQTTNQNGSQATSTTSASPAETLSAAEYGAQLEQRNAAERAQIQQRTAQKVASEASKARASTQQNLSAMHEKTRAAWQSKLQQIRQTAQEKVKRALQGKKENGDVSATTGQQKGNLCDCDAPGPYNYAANFVTDAKGVRISRRSPPCQCIVKKKSAGSNGIDDTDIFSQPSLSTFPPPLVGTGSGTAASQTGSSSGTPAASETKKTETSPSSSGGWDVQY